MIFSVGNVSRSIFVKLFFVLLATGFVVNAIVFTSVRKFMGPSPELRKLVETNLDYFAERVIRDVGIPPDESRAKELSARLGFQMRIRYEGKETLTSSSVIGFEEASREDHRRRPLEPPPIEGPAFGAKRPHALDRLVLTGTLKIDDKPLDYVLMANTAGGPRFAPPPKALAWLSILVTLVLVGAFFWLNQILRPLRALNEGVTQLGVGNFGHRVVVQGRDELGRLGNSFNQMAGSIQEMVARKEQLLIDVSHELRSPITRMKVALEFYPSERTRENIADELREMDQMLQELLEGARLDSSYGTLTLQNTDLSTIIQSLVSKYEASKPSVRLARIPVSCPMVADPARLAIVVKNLLENALKHSPAEKPVEISVVEGIETVCIEVKDQGPGIPPEELGRVFEAFYRVDKSRSRDTGGFGLGLHLSRKIARAHGGEIELISEPDQGTLARVILPKKAAAS